METSLNPERQKSNPAVMRRGMRLWRVEVLNWGTLGDNTIHATDVNGGWLCITGNNGTGKSTLADAIITAFPPAHSRILYNAAGGAKNTKERTRLSYLKGYFGSEQDDSGRTTPSALRKQPGTLTAILQQYHEEGTDNWVTSLVLGTFFGADDDQWLYCIINQKQSLDVIKGTEDWDARAKRLRKSGWQITAEPGPYRDRLRALLNIPTEKAIQTFVRTVGLKDIGEVNGFIRGNMLDDVSAHERYTELTKHYEKQIEIDREIELTKSMIEMLRPLGKSVPVHRELLAQLSARELVEEAVEWRAQKTLADAYVRHAEAMQAKLIELQGLAKEQEQIVEEGERAIAALGNSEAAHRAKEFARRAQDAKKDHDNANNQLVQLRAALSIIGTVPLPKTPAEFASMSASLQRLVADADQSEESKSRELFVEEERVRKLVDERNACWAEVQELLRINSHLPRRDLEARAQIADAVGLKSSDLPYAGELLDVSEKEGDWRIAIEKLLRTFARRVLVPAAHATKVLEYVKATKFDGHRVRLEIVPAAVTRFTLGTPAPEAACHKIKIKPHTPFTDWLFNTMSHDFDHACHRELAGYEKARGKALTIEGLFKGGARDYHEKRDDIEIRGPRDHYLGWNNEEKVKAMNRAIAELDESIRELREVVNAKRATNANARAKRDAAHSILASVRDFQSIDVASAGRRMAEIEQQRQLLAKTDPDAAAIETKIAGVSQSVDAAKKNLTGLTEELGGVRTRREAVVKEITAIEEWEESHACPTEEHLKAAEQFFTKPPPDAHAELPRWAKEIEKACAAHFQGVAKRSSELALDIKGVMSRYLATYPNERKNLHDDIGASLAFLERLQELEGEKLYELQDRFRSYLKDNLALHVSQLKGLLDTEVSRTRSRIEEINRILQTIPWSDNCIIRILPRKNTVQEIRSFEELLKKAAAPLLSPTDGEKLDCFAAVKELIKFLENENARKLVLDARNWSLFAVEWLDTSGPTPKRSDIKEDTGGLSGGQKAKLSVTLLASALAFQYDIAGAHAAPNTFRTVLIDEAFSKLDGTNARYALDLFKRFDFQLLLIHPLDGTVRVAEEYVQTMLLATIRDNRHSCLTPVTISAIDSAISATSTITP